MQSQREELVARQRMYPFALAGSDSELPDVGSVTVSVNAPGVAAFRTIMNSAVSL
jgi:hypothetical protein